MRLSFHSPISRTPIVSFLLSNIKLCSHADPSIVFQRSSTPPNSRRNSPLRSDDDSEIPKILHSSRQPLNPHSSSSRVRLINCRSLPLPSYSTSCRRTRTRRLPTRRSAFNFDRPRSLRTSPTRRQYRVARAQSIEEHFSNFRRPSDYRRNPSKVYKPSSSRHRGGLRLSSNTRDSPSIRHPPLPPRSTSSLP